MYYWLPSGLARAPLNGATGEMRLLALEGQEPRQAYIRGSHLYWLDNLDAAATKPALMRHSLFGTDRPQVLVTSTDSFSFTRDTAWFGVNERAVVISNQASILRVALPP